jgi:hypothetical protein
MNSTIDNKFYIVYKTTNLINNRFYIGIHITTVLDDGYLGSGKRLKYEIKKYGKHNFQREILYFLNSKEELLLTEAQLVTESLLANKLCLNLAKGGKSAWYMCNTPEGIENRRHTFKLRSIGGNKAIKQKRLNDPDFNLKIITHLRSIRHLGLQSIREKYPNGTFYGKSHTDVTRQKMSTSHKSQGNAIGDRNSQYGTMWIYNIETLKSVKIKIDDIIPIGWIKGRKIKTA